MQGEKEDGEAFSKYLRDGGGLCLCEGRGRNHYEDT